MPDLDLARELTDYKKFFDDTPVALIRTDLKTGEFLMANKFAIQLLGYDNFDHLKKELRASDLYPSEDRKRLIHLLKRQGNIRGMELSLHLPGSRTIWVAAYLHINCDGHCIEGSLIDITELVEMRQKQLSILKEVGRKIDNKIAALAS